MTHRDTSSGLEFRGSGSNHELCRKFLAMGLALPLASKACAWLAVAYMRNEKRRKDTMKIELDKEKTNRRASSMVNCCLVADNLIFFTVIHSTTLGIQRKVTK